MSHFELRDELSHGSEQDTNDPLSGVVPLEPAPVHLAPAAVPVIRSRAAVAQRLPRLQRLCSSTSGLKNIYLIYFQREGQGGRRSGRNICCKKHPLAHSGRDPGPGRPSGTCGDWEWNPDLSLCARARDPQTHPGRGGKLDFT